MAMTTMVNMTMLVTMGECLKLLADECADLSSLGDATYASSAVSAALPAATTSTTTTGTTTNGNDGDDYDDCDDGRYVFKGFC